MKKHSLWIVLGAILLIEIILYFMIVSPLGGEIEDKTQKLNKALGKRGLEKYKKKGGKIPTNAGVKRHEENRQTLEDEYKACIAFYRSRIDSQGLKKWFPGLATTWDNEPTPAQFQSVYKDEFRVLRDRCRDNGIAVSGKAVKVLVELKSGEKVDGELMREGPEGLFIKDQSGERLIEQSEIKNAFKYVLKYTPEEQGMITSYQRFSQKPQPNTADTVPDVNAEGFWETSQLSELNLRTAQIQYWVQKAFLDALIEAGGKQIVFVSFYREPPPRTKRGVVQDTTTDGISEHFNRIPVTVLVRMPYGSIARMLRALNGSGTKIVDMINMEFKGLRVVKPLLSEVSTNPLPEIDEHIRYTQQGMNGVMRKVWDKNGGVSFGTQPVAAKVKLPDQDKLVSEPAVLVEFSYNVMDMKAPQSAETK